MGDDPFNPKLLWKVGLIASNGKYLTTDTFGPLLHATGTSMQKKQIFTVDPQGEFVYLIAPNNCFLVAGQKGELNAGEKSRPGTNGQWHIEAQDDGRWAFKSSFGYYMGHKGEAEVHSFGRSHDADTEKFHVQLAIHPQVCIRNNARASYMHLEGGYLNVNEKIPWGVDALINIGYVDGKYSLQASNGKFLNSNGDLVDRVDASCCYILVIKEDNVAFKASNGKYLQTSGAAGKVHAKSTEITKNELFQMEDSHPQVTLVVGGKYVTWKQGNDVKAIHELAPTAKDPSGYADTEIFQMEIDRAATKNGAWSFRNCEGGYLTLKEGNLFTTATQAREKDSWFFIEWLGASIALRGMNGKFVQRSPNGSLAAKADTIDDNCKFIFQLDNRPQLVLRSEFGFLFPKVTQGKNLINCTGPVGEVFQMECKDGQYALKCQGNYLKLEADGSLNVAGGSPEWFHITLPVHTKMAICSAATGKYLSAAQTGAVKHSSNDYNTLNEIWEY
jgi:fascin 1/2